MKRKSFMILTSLLFGFILSLCLFFGHTPSAYSQDKASDGAALSLSPRKTSGAYVIEDIAYDPETQIYTYTYVLHNLGKQQVWWWGIWYEEDPQAILDDSSVDENGFAPTDLTDCSPGWKNSAPEGRMGFYLYSGPNGELGFYSTYASDFRSGNSPIVPESINVPRLGGQWGWNGPGANIITAYGIQKGQTGYYVIRSKKYFPENKMFFYNTKDYWNSYFDPKTGQLVIGGLEFVSITQRSYSISMSLTRGYNLISQPLAELITSDNLSSASYQASTLLSSIPGCQKVIRFDPKSQKTESYLSWDGTAIGIDFPIKPGEGYYTEVSTDTTFNLTGLLATEPQTLNLSQGYNLISFIYGPNMPDDPRTGYSSSSLLSAIPGCKSVIRFNPVSQKTESYRIWAGYKIGTEFDIRVGEGYMVEVQDDISWTPAKLSLPRMRFRQSQLESEPRYDLTSSALPAPIISEVRESYQTAGSVVISWITDIDSPGEVHYSSSRDLSDSKLARDSVIGKVHWVELSGLQPGTTYYYEVQSGASVDNNAGSYYLYTAPKVSPPLDNVFIGGRLVKPDQSPLAGALVLVTINHRGVYSYPLSTRTTKDGIWLLNLADLKNSLTGDSLPNSPNDPVLIEVNGGDGWQADDTTRMISDLTEDKAYTLIVSSPTSVVLATPIFSPPSCTFIGSITVSIACAIQGATIRYTKDGSEPTANSPAYTTPLTLTETTTIKAKAFNGRYALSNTASETYTRIREKVAAPVLSPSSGTFNDSIPVSITCATPGATIRYTKDGSEPTANSPAYTSPLTLTKTTTLKVKAFKSGYYTPSDTVSGTYTKLEKMATPVISPVVRTFIPSVSVSITCATQGATICYTTDGSEPTESSPVYTAPLTLTTTTTVKAKAFKEGYIPSEVVSAIYTKLAEKVATPLFSLPSGIFTGSVSVSITCATQGATICYTTDGSEPTESSPVYTAPLTLTTTTTIKAKAFKEGYTPSTTAQATYTRKVAVVAKPTLSPSSGTFTNSVSVSITCATPGATIRYTKDGSEPTESSPTYTAPLTLTSTTTVKAKAFKYDYTPSDVVSGTYTIKPKQPSSSTPSTPIYTSGTSTLWTQPWSYSYSALSLDYQPSYFNSLGGYQQLLSSWNYSAWPLTSSWSYSAWPSNF